jgi:hypothetical protein
MWSSFCESYRQNGLRRIAGLGNSHDELPSVNAYAQLDGPKRSVLLAAKGMSVTLQEGLAMLPHHIGDFYVGSAHGD